VAVLGVEDSAVRRGHHYATVPVDPAGGHRPVDVFIGAAGHRLDHRGLPGHLDPADAERPARDPGPPAR
jgi:hypothetical protein